MYLIDQTYFIKQYNIPNLNEMDSDVFSNLEQYIDKDVRSLLRNALGYSLFKDLDSNITDGVLNVGAPQKWQDFVNGVEYTKDDNTVKWKGIAYEEGLSKTSLLVPYVYHNWLRDNISQVTGIGEKVISAQNAVNANSNQRIVAAWNDFMDMYQGDYRYGRKETFFLRGVRFTDWLGDNYDEDVPLIIFLEDNDDTYTDALKVTYVKQNQLGI